jgi:hypothetical protein
MSMVSANEHEPSKDDGPYVPDGNVLPLRAGSAVLPDDRWYNLKFNYEDADHQIQTGYAYFVGEKATWSFWDYISATASNGPMAKFKKVKTEGDRMQLEMQDGNYLSCRAAPRLWLYRSSAYPVGWEIVDGKLYTDWHNGAIGVQYHSIAVPAAYYLGVNTSPELTNCEWVLASPQ